MTPGLLKPPGFCTGLHGVGVSFPGPISRGNGCVPVLWRETSRCRNSGKQDRPHTQRQDGAYGAGLLSCRLEAFAQSFLKQGVKKGIKATETPVQEQCW
ncbi:PRELI domain-containing protein 2 [Columba livia]|uniref:PRELI domain-containing protein 2 n=1 Tax=Columba livia TaxID=8932 RepID=UPI0031BB2599